MSPNQRLWTIVAVVVISIGASLTYARSEMSQNDDAFLTDAIKADNSEVALGRLAAQKGGSQGVRSFGETLATDHAQAKTEAAALAEKLNISFNDEITSEAAEEQQKLQELSGADFDKEFLSYMISDHKKDISMFQKQANADKAATAALARKTLPTLRKHLDTAQSLKGSM